METRQTRLMQFPPFLRKKILRAVALVAGIAYAALFTFGCCCADSMIFPAPPPGYDASLSGLVKLNSPAGDIAALWLPSEGAKTALLYFHGNGEDIGYIADMLAEYREKTGCAVLAADYPGYGLSPGKPSEDGCYAAADAALARLKSDYGYTPDRVVIVGRSLGTGVAVDLASRTPVKGLVLISPFKSTFRVITGVKLLPIDRFDSLAKIEEVKCPLLVIHGEHDEVIPFKHGKQLFDEAVNASPRAFLAVPEGRHNDGIPGSRSKEFWDGLREMAR